MNDILHRQKTRQHLEESKKVEPHFLTEHVPIVWKKAYGTTIEDLDGNKFLDFTSGILNASIGHSHPKWVKEVQQQTSELLACYDFPNVWRTKFAKELVKVLPDNLNKIYLLTTGTEAVEAALKIARKYTGKYEIISFHMSFHGRTNMALSIGGKKSRKISFGPFASGTIHAPFAYCYRCAFEKQYPSCNLFCVKYLDPLYDTESSDMVGALIGEPYQGAGGIIVPPKEFYKEVEKWCKKRDILLILDEVQAGFGRTGKMFGFQHYDIKPNLVCFGKALTCGIPGAAVAGEEKIMDSLEPGTMSCTYAMSPLVGRAGLAVLEILEEEGLVENSAKIGEYILSRLKKIQGKVPNLGDVRGLGLVIGLEMVEDKESKKPAKEIAKKVVYECFKKGLLVLGPDGFYSNVVVLGPPLIITRENADNALGIIEDVLLSLEGRK